MIHITYVIHSLGKGGAEQQLYYLLKEIDRQAYAPNVICLCDGYWRERIEALGIPVTVCDQKNKLSLCIAVWRQLLSFRPTIVHTYGQTAGLIGRLASIGARIPFVIASERNAVRIKSRSVLFCEKILSFFTDAIICNSQHAADSFQKLKLLSKEKIVVVHNGITFQENTKTTISFDPPVVTYIANFKNQKNHIVLAQAALLIQKKYPRVTFHLAGAKNESWDAFSEFLDENNLQNTFVLHGVISNVDALIAGTTIYAHVSQFEGLPNALMEAMGSGLPCVATDVFGSNELIRHQENGLLVENNNPQALAEAVIFLLENMSQAEKLGEQAFMDIRNNYSVKKMVQATTAVYDNAIPHERNGAN